MSIRDSLGAVISALKHMRDAGTMQGIGPLVAQAEKHFAAAAPAAPAAAAKPAAAKVDDDAMAKYKAAAAKAKGA